MKPQHFVLLAIGFIVATASARAQFAGEYADKNYLHGKAVFQLSVEQSGKEVFVNFSAVHNDGSGAAPEADGKGKVTGSGTVAFTWHDSFKNSGTGTLKRSGNDMLISLKATHVADARCLEFYGDNIKLKPAGKK